MIIYDVTSNNIFEEPIQMKPKQIFVMTKLGKKRAKIIDEIMEEMDEILNEHKFTKLTADDLITGNDYMQKINKLIHESAIGIAIVDSSFECRTLCNIFYECGLMDSIGKETIIIKTEKTEIPSDFVRTEYIEYSPNTFKNKLRSYFKVLSSQAEYYDKVSDNTQKNPIYSIDYTKRAYMLSNSSQIYDKLGVRINKIKDKRIKEAFTNSIIQNIR